ncbi:phasin [Cupriavidus sp. UYMU48A]|nr:phasin [Cupriavidus sp. UYMU48A]
MSFLTSDQFAASHKNNLVHLAKVSNTTLAGIQKLTELNLQAAKAAMAEGQANLKALGGREDLRDVLSGQGNLQQTALDKALLYARRVCEITSQAQAELAKAVEEQYEQHQRDVQAFVDTFLKNAPAGSEAISAMLQATFDAAKSSHRSAQAISQQLTELASASFPAATGVATGGDRQATRR